MNAQYSSGSTLVSLTAGEQKVLIAGSTAGNNGTIRRLKLTNAGDYPVWFKVGENGPWAYLEAKTEFPMSFQEEPQSAPNVYVKTFDNATPASGLAGYAY